MKRLLIVMLVLSLVSAAAIAPGIRWIRHHAQEQAIVPLDSAALFDYECVRDYVMTPRALAEATQLYLIARDTLQHSSYDRCGAVPVMLRALCICPASEIYDAYGTALGNCDRKPTALRRIHISNIAQWQKEKSKGSSLYIDAAKYAMDQKDTNSTVFLLDWYMAADTAGYRVVDSLAEAWKLESYPGYYSMIDEVFRAHPQMALRGALRTLRFTKPSLFTFELTATDVFKQRVIAYDSMTGVNDDMTYQRDMAISDLIRGNRFGRYSRHPEGEYHFVASLDLSRDFYTYVYLDMSWFAEPQLRKKFDVGTPEAEIKKYEQAAYAESLSAPKTFYLVTLDKYGKKIASQQIACSCSPIHISTATISARGVIDVRDVEQHWATDPLETGYVGNTVASRTVTATHRYRVSDIGTITEIVSAATAVK